MNKVNKGYNAAEKVTVIVSVGVLIISLLLGYWQYALGVAVASIISWFLYRWQMVAVVNLDGLSPQKATIRMVTRSTIRLLAFLSMVILSSLIEQVFFFGILTGVLLQMMAYIGQAFFIFIKKGGIA